MTANVEWCKNSVSALCVGSWPMCQWGAASSNRYCGQVSCTCALASNPDPVVNWV